MDERNTVAHDMSGGHISLLYPTDESRTYHQNRANLPHISAEVCRELGLTELFSMKSAPLSDFFTKDEEVIRYRQAAFADVSEIPELKEDLLAGRPVLDDICELRTLDGGEEQNDYLTGIMEIELYVSCLDTLSSRLLPVRDRIRSEAFGRLSDFVGELTSSDYYRELNKKLTALSARVREIRSITVGVNLDARLSPTDAGVLSVNAEPFKSGRVLDKILRLSFRNDDFTTIAPLTPVGRGDGDNKREAMIGAFHGAIEDVFRSSVRGWRQIVETYVLDSTDFLLRLLPEIEFIARSAELIDRLRARPDCPLVFPTVAARSEHAFRAENLYNPRVALAIDGDIVTNDFAFDERAGFYILTGPNRGGKSVVTVAVGAAQALFQLGLPVPASAAVLSVADGIFTHFPEGADDTIDKGRLGEECARLKEIFDASTPDSLILLDESLSSTGAYEASYIASEILTAFATLGCRGIFSTHLHELAAAVGDINARVVALGGVPVDTLVAGMEAGHRSFRIERKTPDGKSYARDIADRYGLSFDTLEAEIETKKKRARA